MRHFDIEEFDSPDLKGSGQKMNKALLNMLDEAREIAGIPFIINSGFRTAKHNAKVGGISNSSHRTGHAVDIRCADNGHRMIMLNALQAVGFNRIGIAKTFIHVDNDPKKLSNRIWLY